MKGNCVVRRKVAQDDVLRKREFRSRYVKAQFSDYLWGAKLPGVILRRARAGVSHPAEPPDRRSPRYFRTCCHTWAGSETRAQLKAPQHHATSISPRLPPEGPDASAGRLISPTLIPIFDQPPVPRLFTCLDRRLPLR
jgi:hypothetical protein